MRRVVFAIMTLMLLGCGLAAAQDAYVTVSIAGKVFDEPNAKGYVTLNQNNKEVTVIPGMVFKSLEHQAGWYMIEYSPGLRGYVSEEILETPAKAPVAGTYKLANAPAKKVTVADNGKWTLQADGKTLTGKAVGYVVVFGGDESGYPAYSLVQLADGPAAVTYDNTVTAFF